MKKDPVCVWRMFPFSQRMPRSLFDLQDVKGNNDLEKKLTLAFNHLSNRTILTDCQTAWYVGCTTADKK